MGAINNKAGIKSDVGMVAQKVADSPLLEIMTA
jgi:hypothetical protein